MKSIQNQNRRQYRIVTQNPDGILVHKDGSAGFEKLENGCDVIRISDEIRILGNRRWYAVSTNYPGRRKAVVGWVASTYLEDAVTVDNRASIKDHLELIDDASKASLKLDHASLLFSFEQMLVYSKTIATTGLSEELSFLLDTYREMAERFYTQYELSLLRTITGLTPGKKNYKELTKGYSALLQQALEKLRDEWLRLSTIATSSQLLKQDEDLLNTLEVVVNAAAYYVGVETKRIIVVPGNDFSLYFFRYLDNFAVLSVPIYSVRAPWEWSIFWHELAGYKVRQLETVETLVTTKKNLEKLKQDYTSPDVDKELLLTGLLPDYPFCRGYLEKLLTVEQQEMDLDELGGFEYQFDRLKSKVGEDEQEEFKLRGWKQSWFEELFEDAWSVLAIGRPFIPLFEEILDRHGARDDRHPEPRIRVRVAKELLELAEKAYTDESEARSRSIPIERRAARQILLFISLLRAGSRETTGAEVQVDPRVHLFEDMKTGIQDAIEYWNRSNEKRENAAQDGAPAAELTLEDAVNNYLERVSDTNSFKQASGEYADFKKNQPIPTYEQMLGDKNYQELQTLSFFDADFGFPVASIKAIRFGQEIVTTKKFKTIPATIKINLYGSCKVLGRGGKKDITYQGPDGQKYHAPLASWNAAFASRPEYCLP